MSVDKKRSAKKMQFVAEGHDRIGKKEKLGFSRQIRLRSRDEESEKNGSMFSVPKPGSSMRNYGNYPVFLT
ncbi:MAG: hypothetical protein D6690_03225 [Nitrospirae bacterium]|nr:MAG: hypothetical protein D6690_03225 [Nitrospirota bacterium]